jgi:cell division protein FtsA
MSELGNMSKGTERKLIVGLDIGTSNVKAVVGELLNDNSISIVGVGSHSSKGMDKGGVNDLNLVVQSVKRAVHEMELMADCSVSSVFMSISGRHVKCQNESGMVPINNQEVTQEDVDNVVHAARSVPIAAERRLLKIPLACQALGWKRRRILLPVPMTWLKIWSSVWSAVN